MAIVDLLYGQKIELQKGKELQVLRDRLKKIDIVESFYINRSQFMSLTPAYTRKEKTMSGKCAEYFLEKFVEEADLEGRRIGKIPFEFSVRKKNNTTMVVINEIKDDDENLIHVRIKY